MTQLFELPAAVTAPVAGEQHGFPVRRIFCVGRNYAEHAREMGKDPERDPPFFFTKWAETVVFDGTTVPYPQKTGNFHYEAELVVAIGQSGRNLSREEALDHVYGYATGLDMTRRDLQLEARSSGRPWDTGKNVEASSPLGLIHPAAASGHPETGAIRMRVNGEVRQSADLADLIWPVADILVFLSGLYRIEPGDLVYTGTPAGVGAVVEGDELRVEIDGLTAVNVRVGPPAA
ncbi:fumarylacetoacetate hydrolase family protein [Sphingomonas sp. AP4-R1]|uniref:fumarylacetoacetate hydrolase family protein n=1 Tax=Sphingomonas sp. AP4-R1 TaxID=2735134 RepID=UPI0014934694|nr:fumarylacetoacetate hydrolase family protein [Sphingomonas sp. AP4-R1]QJU58187.1 fumarylacetoacetate hydrolase family protein [Sphingomonas sp. AP4-R1]